MPTEEILKDAETHMKASVHATHHECQKIRTGRANAAILDGIDVECYGAKSPISHVANISIPEPRTIVIQPYDRSLIKAIDTAIQKSDIGLNPSNDGSVIRLNLPPLTEERRKDLVKVVRKIGEEGKVAIRNQRHKSNDKVKKGEKDGSIPEDEGKRVIDEIQKLTDRYSAEIDKLLKEKEEEILHF
ncbi:MAG: ribosome recycling factor [Candidatus Omnitrophica bacterium]|nr:Ribosome-recycling factor [bacterium]NUN94840.1 ribosome recycling factor [Candidatus Omnitrophota bacterium]